MTDLNLDGSYLLSKPLSSVLIWTEQLRLFTHLQLVQFQSIKKN